MSKRFLAAVAFMVAAVFGSTILAQAADITFGGQMRPRYEVFEQNDFNKQTDPTHFFLTRIRLNTKVKVDDNIGAFIQFQARGVYGAGSGGLIPGPAPGPRNAAVPADGLVEVGLHQAYFTVKNFFNMPVDLKFGRQEIILDGHRLFGNTGWTTGAQSADAIRLDHHHEKSTFSYIFIKAIEAQADRPFAVGGNSAGSPTNLGPAGPGGLLGQGTCGTGGLTNFNDNCDREDHVFWANMKGLVPNAQVSLYAVITIDNSWNASPATNLVQGVNADNNIYTFGPRIAGTFMGFKYRGEFYYQGGQAEGIATQFGATGAGNTNPALVNANAAAATNFVAGGGSGVTREAYMFGVRVGRTLKAVPWSPTITVWYDRLSGTDSSDVNSGTWGTFDTLYDTGHKFYGFMDTYLNATGSDTSFLGLQDLAIKTVFKPMKGWVIKADLHHFATEAEARDLGQELDLTFVHKYSPNLTLTAGYSRFFAEDNFHQLNLRAANNRTGNVSPTVGTGNEQSEANWGYVQMDLKF